MNEKKKENNKNKKNEREIAAFFLQKFAFSPDFKEELFLPTWVLIENFRIWKIMRLN